MLLISSMLYLQHFFFKLGVSSSIGKALNGLLVLKLVALQMGGLKTHFFGIGRNLATESLEDSLGQVRIVY